MYSRTNDPRYRRTLNTLSQNIEAANESAQQGIFTFGQNYVNPCLAGISGCVHSWSATCFPSREDRLRSRRNRGRAGPEQNFDFYDDWDEDEDLGWGNDELERLLTGSTGYATISAQPGRQRGMSYGTRRDKARRKSIGQPHDIGPDPTLIPSSSYFGFLGRLPFNVGGKGLRYKPSAADLQEHPGALRRSFDEEQPLIEESEDEAEHNGKNKHVRQRSTTNASGHTTDSLSSRGDIFPSEDELDDAVPLDDEFAMVLDRRNTGLGEETSSGRTRSSKRPSGSRLSTRTVSSKSIHDTLTRANEPHSPDTARSDPAQPTVPTLSELKMEELRAEQEEERDIQRRRHAAQRLAIERGLGDLELSSSPPTHPAHVELSSSPPQPISPIAESSAPVSPINYRSPLKTFPFPSFETPALDEDTHGEADLDPVSPIQESPPQHYAHAEPEFMAARLPQFSNGPD